VGLAAEGEKEFLLDPLAADDALVVEDVDMFGQIGLGDDHAAL
jgi:hypothetical protein